jgi:beta-lactamase superfamily II metal-dependent hydrolase
VNLTIFDVEHGQCSLLDTDSDGHMLIDCGHNSTTGWRPSVYLPRIGVTDVDRLFITNSDEDHASDLHNLRGAVRISSLTRNPTVTSANIRQLKDQDLGPGIGALCDMLDEYVHPVQPNPRIDDIGYRKYFNTYPEFDNENDLSMVIFFDFGENKVCFTGDMTRRGWLALLQNAAFRAELPSTSIFLASHHGRDDGCCEELYSVGGLAPVVTIISDSGVEHATQETVQWYANRSSGFKFHGETRRVLTTRSDGDIEMKIDASGAIQIWLGAYESSFS